VATSVPNQVRRESLFGCTRDPDRAPLPFWPKTDAEAALKPAHAFFPKAALAPLANLQNLSRRKLTALSQLRLDVSSWIQAAVVLF
jgi:hypothetical protein